MAGIDITSLFADVLPNPQRQLEERTLQQSDAANQASLVGELGGMAAYLAPQRGRAMAAAGKGLLGIDTRTSADKLREQMKGLDSNNPDDLIKLAQLLENTNPEKSMQLRSVAVNLRKNQAAETLALTDAATEREELATERTAMSAFVTGAESLTDSPARKAALIQGINSGSYERDFEGLIKATGMDNERYKVLGGDGGVLDTYEGIILEGTAQETLDGSGSMFEFSKIDIADWERESFAKYRTESLAATTVAERVEAEKWLVPVHPDEWEWQKVKDHEGNVVLKENGTPKLVGMPIGDDLITMTQEMNAANFAGEEAKNQISNVLDTIDNIFTQLDGDLTTGFTTSLVKYIPGTKPFTLAKDIDSVLAMLGYQSLQDARKASANGSSGFGQLTQKELEDLRSLVSALDSGMDEASFRQRLTKIKENFERGRRRAKSDWTPDTWRGTTLPSPEIQAEEEALKQATTSILTVTGADGKSFTLEPSSSGGDQ